MRRAWLVGLLTICLLGCDYLPWYPEGAEDPVAVARGFIAAARRGDCKDAWSYFPEQTREQLRQESQRAIRAAPQDSLLFAPYRIQCTPYESYRPSTVELASSDGAHATVGVMERVAAPQSSGWKPSGHTDTRRTMELIHEADGWKIQPSIFRGAAFDPRHQTNQ